MEKESGCKKLTIYIAGKISGLPFEEVREKFKSAEILWLGRGYEVVNPIEVIVHVNEQRQKYGLPLMEDWQEIMRYLLPFIALCDEIFMIRDWKFSKGATIEHHLMESLGCKVHFEVEDFVGGR